MGLSSAEREALASMVDGYGFKRRGRTWQATGEGAPAISDGVMRRLASRGFVTFVGVVPGTHPAATGSGQAALIGSDVSEAPRSREEDADVWYHGSPYRFEQFHRRIGRTFGTGASEVPLFLTRDPKFAALHARAHGYIYTVRPHVEQTFDARSFVLNEQYWPPPRDALTPEGQSFYDDLVENRIFPELIRYRTKREDEDEWSVMHDSHGTYASILGRQYDVMETTEMKRWLRANDYDSFLVRGDGPDDNLAVFDPGQIEIMSTRSVEASGQVKESARASGSSAALKAMRIYLGSVDFASVRDQQRLYARVTQSVQRVASSTGMSFNDVWDQTEAEARRQGILRPMPGQHI